MKNDKWLTFQYAFVKKIILTLSIYLEGNKLSNYTYGIWKKRKSESLLVFKCLSQVKLQFDFRLLYEV